MFPDFLEGTIFSRSLNDNRRMIMTGLCFIRFSSQNVCFSSAYSKKKNTNLNQTELKSGKDEPKPNHEFWTAGNQYFAQRFYLSKESLWVGKG